MWFANRHFAHWHLWAAFFRSWWNSLNILCLPNCCWYRKRGDIAATDELPVSYKWFKGVIDFSFASIAFRAVSTLANLLLFGCLWDAQSISLVCLTSSGKFFWLSTLSEYQSFLLPSGIGSRLSWWDGMAVVNLLHHCGLLVLQNLRRDPPTFETGTMMQPSLYKVLDETWDRWTCSCFLLWCFVINFKHCNSNKKSSTVVHSRRNSIL